MELNVCSGEKYWNTLLLQSVCWSLDQANNIKWAKKEVTPQNMDSEQLVSFCAKSVLLDMRQISPSSATGTE